MKEEMMNDAVDDVIGDEEDDEERYVSSNEFFGAGVSNSSWPRCRIRNNMTSQGRVS